MQLVLGEDVQVEALDAEKHGGLDHGEGLLQPVAAGYHRQVHGRLWPAGDVVSARLCKTPLAHDVPGETGQKDGWMDRWRWEISKGVFRNIILKPGVE